MSSNAASYEVSDEGARECSECVAIDLYVYVQHRGAESGGHIRTVWLCVLWFGVNASRHVEVNSPIHVVI